MKKQLTFILVILVGILSFSAISLDWGRLYQMNGTQDSFFSVANGNGVYLIGSTNESGYDENGLVANFDKNGELIGAPKTFGGDLSDWVTSAIINSDNELVAVGASNSFGSDFDYYISVFGDKNKSSYYKDFGNSKATSVVEVKNSYVVVGYSQDPKSLNYKGKIVKFDKDLNVLWERWLPFVKEGVDVKPLNVYKTSDNYLIITGVVVDYFKGNTELYIAKTTVDGVVIWNEVSPVKDYARAFQSAELSDGYVVTGYTGTWKDKWSDIYLAKYSKDGKLLWEKTYGLENSDHGYAVTTYNNKIYIAGYLTTENKKDIVLMELDNEGNELANDIFGGSGDDVAYSVSADGMGSIYVSGYSTSKDFGSDEKDLIVVKYSIK